MKKFSSFLIVLLLMLVSFTSHAQGYPRGDVNQDGVTNISDVTSLINYLLSGSWPDQPVTPPDEHEWVDLGLPSGTLWATCNVGANVPEEYGDYFAWGETEPKEFYSDWTYKWCQYIYPHYDPSYTDGYKFTKYCTDSSYGYNGFVDNKTELDPEDDAAYVNWGTSWRMPTKEQFQELCEQCTWQWTTQNGVNGDLVTGPNGNTLFLPCAGGVESNVLFDWENGYYWSRSLYSTWQDCAYMLYFDSGYVGLQSNLPRFCGITVRAVRVP